MDQPLLFRVVADLVLVAHLGIVIFVVVGLVLIVVGNRLGWTWVNHWWIRVAHLAAIGVVVVQAWLGATCPLTTLEAWLRLRAGAPVHGVGCIEYWVEWLLFHDWPTWAFTLAYTLFGLLVAAAWWYFPPRASRRGRD